MRRPPLITIIESPLTPMWYNFSMNQEQSKYNDLFNEMHPDFFERDYIKNRPDEEIFDEMILGLEDFEEKELPVPTGITYGLFTGNITELHSAVREVVPHWVDFFNEGDRVYCGYAGDEIACFCIIEEMGEHPLDGRMIRVGGPGCVGTVPKFRRQGIGLKMVQDVTRILRDEGYDISYIHYTGVAHWYAKLGYRSVVRWNKNGIIN